MNAGTAEKSCFLLLFVKISPKLYPDLWEMSLAFFSEM